MQLLKILLREITIKGDLGYYWREMLFGVRAQVDKQNTLDIRK